MNTNTLFIPCHKETWELDVFMKGLLWSDTDFDNVVFVVCDYINHPQGRVKQETLDLVYKHAQENGFEVFADQQPGANEKACGRGLALYRAMKKYPSTIYTKIDPDMFPLTRLWALELGNAIASGDDTASSFCNMNGLCSKRFIERLGLNWSEYSDLDRIPYADVDAQVKLWNTTFSNMDRLLRWDMEYRYGPNLNRAENWLINSNVVAFSHEWFMRRDSETDWDIIGEDELAFNIAKPGDDDYFYLDDSSMFLHWGYTPARHLLNSKRDEVCRILVTHWRS